MGPGHLALTFTLSVPQAFHLGQLGQQAAVVSFGSTEEINVTWQHSGGHRNSPGKNLEQGGDPAAV